ncbi:MerR family transcriptional regulator [Actinacidiphila sp. DG2A-62]|jgi:DNA-binding transcriptional MerR regulator|uniref:MerR family transcriptional regulator n=1 Tax=Actinacidiphila sp. DG2A-62 TaxID=3108821 RepID=UPI002DB8F3F1|nr:MerR family transcriptional regulator [Actinacidiphila sp. DG2A-62]MEC3994059.1 MerR family transcriptional regulator [Actinacidiphila sp. DG2A-62]
MTVVQMAQSTTGGDTDTRQDAGGDTRGRTGGGVDRGPSSAANDCARAVGLPRPDGQDQYTISEVADFTGLSAHTLRWYERIGLMPHVDRSHTGQRRFSNRDLDWLAFVGKLRLTGMPVADMVSYAEMVRAGQQTFAQRRALLESTRADVLQRIAELQDTLAVLDRKIDTYGACLVPGRTSA